MAASPKIAPLIGRSWQIALVRHDDERGGFAETYREEWLARMDRPAPRFVQDAISWNQAPGTLRGMHMQRGDAGQEKLVTCVQGRILDVVLDADPGSPTYGKWAACELDARKPKAILIAPGLAHGFQTLEANTIVGYKLSAYYAPGAEVTVDALDPALAIDWPLPVAARSPRDASAPGLAQIAGSGR